MKARTTAAVTAALIAVAGCAACSASDAAAPVPGLAERGTAMTTAKLSRKDLTSKVSLSGKVTLNPVFGLVAPVAGQIRYVEVKASAATPTKPTRAGGVWADGKSTAIDVPAGSVFAGRLVADKSTVGAGTPVVSATYGGLAIVAEVDGAQAYQVSDTLNSVTAQIKSGPGPFPCAVLGTIAALPAGTIPEPPAPPQPPQESTPDPKAPVTPPVRQPKETRQPSEATGMRLICTPAPGVKLINGATATVEVVTESVTGALVAPVESVAGRQGAGKVEVVAEDGTRQVRDVVLGLTDGKVVQIKSGLTGTETLAVPGPNLPPAPQPDQNQNGGPSKVMGG